jgi:hypothetical protein
MRRLIRFRTCGLQIGFTSWTRTFRHQSGLSTKFHKAGRTGLVSDLKMPSSGELKELVPNRRHAKPAGIDPIYQKEVGHV